MALMPLTRTPGRTIGRTLAHTLALALALPLAAQAVPPAAAATPLATVAFGAYRQSVSDGNGTWQGLILDATWDPWKDGKFIGSLLTLDRPMGSGTVASVGKYQQFHGGFGFLGVATSTGAAYLPTLQVVTDLNFELPVTGLVLGGGLTYTRVRDGHQDWLAALGPTLYLGDFITTLRLCRNRSNPGAHDSGSTLLALRHGAQDAKAWQSLHLSWGAEAYQNLVVREAVQARGIGAGVDCFFLLGRNWTLQTGVEWAQKYGSYHLWGGSVRLGWMLP